MAGGARLGRWEAVVLAGFLGWLLFFQELVVLRSALLSRPMGDLACFLRGGWAVRTGQDLFDITDPNGWHYNYPPLVAILSAPLALPDGLAGDAWVPPYAISVSLFYKLSLLALALGVHLLASALEQASGDRAWRSQPVGCRRWWYLRTFPVLICAAPVGFTLGRGQVNLFVAGLVCAAAAWVVRRRRALAGGALAVAACVKIFPAYLVLYPLWRRDGRGLAGYAAGLFGGLVLVPVAVMGPARAAHSYQRLGEVLIGPAFEVGGDTTRARELLNATATDNQSFQVVLHNVLHPDPAARPHQASRAVKLAHVGAVLVLTGVVLTAARWRGRRTTATETLLLATLGMAMTVSSPVCHMHYFVMAIPLFMGLLAARWENGETSVGVPVWVLAALTGVGYGLPLLPSLTALKDFGMPLLTTLVLIGAGCVVMWREGRQALSVLPAAAEDGSYQARAA